MPYTILIREQVMERTRRVPDVNDTFRIIDNPGPLPVYPAGASLLYAPADLDIYAADPLRRQVLLFDPNGTATAAAICAQFPQLKTNLIGEIKEIRAMALELATKNSGVSAIYDENYQASLAVSSGFGDTSIQRNGMTATQYLTGFGSRLGMTAAQFATYIIAENRRIGPTSYQVEDEYLRLAYRAIPQETDADILFAYPGSFRRFCGL